MKLSQNFPRPNRCAWLLVGLLLVTGNLTGAVQDHQAQPGIMLLRGVEVDLITDGKLSFRIDAEVGEMHESSRVIHLFRPTVRIYDSKEMLRDQINGQEGYLWPSKLPAKEGDAEVDPDNEESERSAGSQIKYDWEVIGDVTVDSTKGYELQSRRIRFDSGRSRLSTDAGVRYEFPTGRGSVLKGEAMRFEAEIDLATGGLKNWKILENVKLKTSSEGNEEE